MDIDQSKSKFSDLISVSEPVGVSAPAFEDRTPLRIFNGSCGP